MGGDGDRAEGAGAEGGGAVRVGDAAPDFTLPDTHLQPVTLSARLAGGPVAVVFYPSSFTPTCHDELAGLSRRLPAPGGRLRVLAVSTDPSPAQRVWAEASGIDVPLLSDFWPHGRVARRYGVLDHERGVALRATFLVDPGGVVR